jgi:hypothetical protein
VTLPAKYLLDVLGEMNAAPRRLRGAIQEIAERDYGTSLSNIEADDIIPGLGADNADSPVRNLLAQRLITWDHLQKAGWAKETVPRTLERRRAIYDALGIAAALRESLNEIHPVLALSEPIVIAEAHKEWLDALGPGERSGFFWNAYQGVLRTRHKWSETAIGELHLSTNEVLRRLSDPCEASVYATKGLVVGYVQSGKTANFTALAAKAADAGYRLIIVLAGTLNVLREQTQRRIDKELVGRELLVADGSSDGSHDYEGDLDWEEFLTYGGMPSALGSVDWHRLTTAVMDYRPLGQGRIALEFEWREHGKRLNHYDNLRHCKVRLAIIKKHPTVMARLKSELKSLQTDLASVPTLIIDDESDQAGIDTADPEKGKRSATSRELVELLATLPRAQYVGYTATPFANVFVDPNDTADIFPKDYIIGLRRPDGYMGVRDFYDLSSDGALVPQEARPKDFTGAERAFIRDVRGEDEDDANLVRAIDSFVLSGLLKLWRAHRWPDSFKFAHHTMLVHRSHRCEAHYGDAELVRRLYDEAGYASGGPGLKRLGKLLLEDFAPVTKVREPALETPVDLAGLLKDGLLGAFMSRLGTGTEQADVHPAIVVNGDSDTKLNFERGNVWRIVVGGTKLSRGYTIEGLTVSYFRRKVNTADTLMQMGRWFGFRKGYRDLVRLFLGREEGDDGRTDLYEHFGALCLDEEVFRQQLAIYSASEGGVRLTPKQVPPLVPSHLLPPTAKNKMRGAEVEYENMGGTWKESTYAPVGDTKAETNLSKLSALIGGESGDLASIDADAFSGEVRWARVSPAEFRQFLGEYEWSGEEKPLGGVQRYLAAQSPREPGIDSWLLLLPQLQDWQSEDSRWKKSSVVKRTRIDGVRFNTYRDPTHTRLVEQLMLNEAGKGRDGVPAQLFAARQAVCLIYLVRDKSASALQVPAVGMSLRMPKNDVPQRLVFKAS